MSVSPAPHARRALRYRAWQQPIRKNSFAAPGMPQDLRLTNRSGFIDAEKSRHGCRGPRPGEHAGMQRAGGGGQIKTIVVIYAENRSFDYLYGFFPGADGITNASSEQKTQLDHDGTVLPYLTIFGPHGKPDGRFPRMPDET